MRVEMASRLRFFQKPLGEDLVSRDVCIKLLCLFGKLQEAHRQLDVLLRVVESSRGR